MYSENQSHVSKIDALINQVDEELLLTSETMSEEERYVNLAREYIAWEEYEPFGNEIKDLLKDSKSNFQELKKRFGERISFGTAGLRSAMGGGYANMNDLVILQTSQGLCDYIENECCHGDAKRISEAKSQGLMIGFDHRHHSSRFANVCARLFLSRGYNVYFIEKYAATPLIPFGILKKGCIVGIVVTASHNPKDDNGFKVYWDNGSQIIPPRDGHIAQSILKNLKPWMKNYTNYNGNENEKKKENDEKQDVAIVSRIDKDILKNKQAFNVTKEIDDAYFAAIKQYSWFEFDKNDKNNINVAFTPMHGIGNHWMKKAYSSFNLPNYIEVKEQCTPDPEFSTVKFPNPEEKNALDLAMKTASEHGSSLIIANDPDSDRLAVAEYNEKTKKWHVFTGNEIALLLANWTFVNFMKNKEYASQKNKFVMVASTVSSKILESMAEKEGFIFVDTLTGFKWMGNKAIEMKNQGYIFLFAFEVEIGFLIGDVSFDKDGLRCGVCFHQMAQYLKTKENNKTCFEKLNELRKKYGFYEMCNEYERMDDEKLFGIMNGLRNGEKAKELNCNVLTVEMKNGEKHSYPQKMGPYEITRVRDVTVGCDSDQKENDYVSLLPKQPNHQMITFWFKNGSTVTMRNSGTEPKLKYYVETRDDNDPQSATKLLNQMRQSLRKNFMNLKD